MNECLEMVVEFNQKMENKEYIYVLGVYQELCSGSLIGHFVMKFCKQSGQEHESHLSEPFLQL